MTAWRNSPYSTRSSLPLSLALSLSTSLCSGPLLGLTDTRQRERQKVWRRATQYRFDRMDTWKCGKSREKKEGWWKNRQTEKRDSRGKIGERARERGKVNSLEQSDATQLPPPLFLSSVWRMCGPRREEGGRERWEEEREGKGTSKNSTVLLLMHY